VLPRAAPYNTAGGLIALGGHLVAFVAAIIASISGISMVVRHREDCSVTDYSLIAGLLSFANLPPITFSPDLRYTSQHDDI
jgi:hypothetical protein